MPFYISPNTLKQQVKLVVKHWPFTEIKSHQARLLLCRLYGYRDQHDYLKTIDNNAGHLVSADESVVVSHYPQWVKMLAELGSINQIQAKNLLRVLWSAYLEPHKHLAEKLYACQFKFHGQCQDFLENNATHTWLDYRFDDRPSVKDAIEAIGVPHPEVGGIKVNGRWIDFSYLLNDKDSIEVFPHPHEQGGLPYKPAGEVIFLLDVHLARLARYLRMAGFSCLHESKDLGDELLAHLSETRQCILLTRDIGLLKRSNIRYARWVRNTDAYAQFREIVTHYQLTDAFKPFSRCVKCNGLINAIERAEAKPFVPHQIFESQDSFRKCGDCERVYWKGSHYEKIKAILETAM